MNKSEQINELAAALAKAQSELSNPKKTSTNPFFKSKYADLSEVINVSKPILAEHGLSILQLMTFNDGCVGIETILLHISGQFISETFAAPADKIDAQSLGKCVTYFRRYGWAAICGLAQEDDDGNNETGIVKQLESARNIKELSEAWALIPKHKQPFFFDLKEKMKEALAQN